MSSLAASLDALYPEIATAIFRCSTHVTPDRAGTRFEIFIRASPPCPESGSAQSQPNSLEHALGSFSLLERVSLRSLALFKPPHATRYLDTLVQAKGNTFLESQGYTGACSKVQATGSETERAKGTVCRGVFCLNFDPLHLMNNIEPGPKLRVSFLPTVFRCTHHPGALRAACLVANSSEDQVTEYNATAFESGEPTLIPFSPEQVLSLPHLVYFPHLATETKFPIFEAFRGKPLLAEQKHMELHQSSLQSWLKQEGLSDTVSLGLFVPVEGSEEASWLSNEKDRMSRAQCDGSNCSSLHGSM